MVAVCYFTLLYYAPMVSVLLLYSTFPQSWAGQYVVRAESVDAGEQAEAQVGLISHARGSCWGRRWSAPAFWS